MKETGDRERKATIEMRPMSPGKLGALDTFTHAEIMIQEEAGWRSLSTKAQ